VRGRGREGHPAPAGPPARSEPGLQGEHEHDRCRRGALPAGHALLPLRRLRGEAGSATTATSRARTAAPPASPATATWCSRTCRASPTTTKASTHGALLRALAQIPSKRMPQVINKSAEKQLCCTWEGLQFRDSMCLLTGSLAKLMADTRKSSGLEAFPLMAERHPYRGNLDLLCCKLPMCYSSLNTPACMDEGYPIPPRAAFRNDFTDEDVTDEEWENLQRLCQERRHRRPPEAARLLPGQRRAGPGRRPGERPPRLPPSPGPGHPPVPDDGQGLVARGPVPQRRGDRARDGAAARRRHRGGTPRRPLVPLPAPRRGQRPDDLDLRPVEGAEHHRVQRRDEPVRLVHAAAAPVQQLPRRRGPPGGPGARLPPRRLRGLHPGDRLRVPARLPRHGHPAAGEGRGRRLQEAVPEPGAAGRST
jgi:hypothetical protein